MQHLNFDGDCIADDGLDACGGGPVLQLGEQQTGKVTVEPLVSADQLIGEGQSRHQASEKRAYWVMV